MCTESGVCGFSISFCSKVSVCVCDGHVEEVELVVLFMFECEVDVGML